MQVKVSLLRNFQTEGNQRSVILSLILILISRIPFLFSGYGSEEDAWGLILVARNIDLTGVYEVSRMPGHPLQELLLSSMWMWPAWTINLLTAIVSTAGVGFFMLTLKEWKIPHHLTAGWILAFTPIYYINSTNVMDYTWALSLVMLSMYCLSKEKFVFAGVALGLAVGFRITAGAAGVAFAVYLLGQDRPALKIFILAFASLLTATVAFLPAYQVYGTGFFTYYEYFPYPPLLKNIYKGTIGAWGVIGTASVATGILMVFIRLIRGKTSIEQKSNTGQVVSGESRKNEFSKLATAAGQAFRSYQIRWIMMMSVAAIGLYTYSFLKIPQKSAFVIPLIPFLIILFCMMLKRMELRLIMFSLMISCFFFGINLDDPIRGSDATPFAVRTTIGNTPVAMDPLTGQVTADHKKRIRKMEYAKETAGRLEKRSDKTVLIAGWWQNEIQYFLLSKKPETLELVYYEDEKTLKAFAENGYSVYYLPEQDIYNDLRFGSTGFTHRWAKPF